MYRQDGVSCNVIFPGGVRTNIMGNSGTQNLEMQGAKALKPAHDAMPAAVMPEDVARTIVFLAGANGVNGAEVAVDQGWRTM